MSEPCDRCKKQRVLSDYTPNQMATLRLCAACIKADREKRSKAAAGKSGPKPKTPSQLEDRKVCIFLNSIDAKTLELWLATEGYKGTLAQMLKQWALATVERARRKSG